MSTLVLPDARLEMPALLYPKRKPVGKVRINWAHPLAKGLAGFWLFDVHNLDLTLNNIGTDVGNIVRGYHLSGGYAHARDNDDTDRINLGSIDASNPLSCSKNNEFSFLCIAETFIGNSGGDHGTTNPRLIDKSDGGNGLNGYEVDIGSSSIGFNFAINGVAVNNGVTGLITGRVQTFGLTHKASDTRFFIDNKLSGTKSTLSATIPTATANASLLNWNHASDRQYRKPVYLIAVWDTVISDSNMLSLHRNPYQLLGPA